MSLGGGGFSVISLSIAVYKVILRTNMELSQSRTAVTSNYPCFNFESTNIKRKQSTDIKS